MIEIEILDSDCKYTYDCNTEEEALEAFVSNFPNGSLFMFVYGYFDKEPKCAICHDSKPYKNPRYDQGPYIILEGCKVAYGRVRVHLESHSKDSLLEYVKSKVKCTKIN